MRYAIWLLTLGIAVTSSAQPGGNAMRDPAAQLDMLVERLGLSPEQSEAVAPIIAEQGEKQRALIEAARSEGHAGFRAMRPQIKAVQKETDARLAEHLTLEQMDSLMALREETRAMMRERRRDRGSM